MEIRDEVILKWELVAHGLRVSPGTKGVVCYVGQRSSEGYQMIDVDFEGEIWHTQIEAVVPTGNRMPLITKNY